MLVGMEKRGQRWRQSRIECLIELYHYTVICVFYCAAIEQQQYGFGSRPCTHTLCLQLGCNRWCECISRSSPSVKCWPGVCEIDDSRANPHSDTHMQTHT